MNSITRQLINHSITKFSKFIFQISSSFNYVNYKLESHDRIIIYNTHELVFRSEIDNFDIILKFTEYDDGKILIYIYINKYLKLGEYSASLSISDYFAKFKKTDYRNYFELNIYPGKDLNEKLDHFFEWLWSVTDEQLIKIIKGEDWVEVPFDWGDMK